MSRVSVTSLGSSDDDLDAEAISELDPTLILMNIGEEDTLDDTEYAMYSAIAPTAPISTGKQDPKCTARQGGAALHRSAQMDEVAAAYEKRAATLEEALAES